MANEFTVLDLSVPGFTTPTIPGYDKPFGSWSTQEEDGTPQTQCVGCSPEQVQFNMEAPFLIAQQPLILNVNSEEGDVYTISGHILYNAYIVVQGKQGTEIKFTQRLNARTTDLIKPPYSGSTLKENYLPEFPIGRKITIENGSEGQISVQVTLPDTTTFQIAKGEIYSITRRYTAESGDKVFTVTKEYPTT